MKTRESGMVLVQVLGIVAIASAITVTMLYMQEGAARGASLARDRRQAEALAYAGEASVLVAFRRDGQNNPETDHYGEAWYTASQAPIETSVGTFSVTIQDAQAKFNLNRLANGVSDRVLFDRIALVTGIAPEIGDRVAAEIMDRGELTSIGELAAIGLTPNEIDAMSAWVTVLPRAAELNIATADPLIVRAVLSSPAAASEFLARRQSFADLEMGQNVASGILLPPGVGLSTSYLEVEVGVESGSARVRLRSFIKRTVESSGTIAWVEARRWS